MNLETPQYARLPVEEANDESLLSDPLLEPLVSDSEKQLGLEDKDAYDELDDEADTQSSKRSSRAVICASVVLLLVSVANLYLLFLNSWTQWWLFNSGLISALSVSVSSVTHENGMLDRPNIYIGLDRLDPQLVQVALPGSLVVYPSLFQPVDHEHPDYVFADDEHARFTFNGRVAPGDHHVLLTNHISMIAQFRVHDYGMERCRIVSTVPHRDVLSLKNQSLVVNGNTSALQVWNITTPSRPHSELDIRNLSWSTKPQRNHLIGFFDVQENSTHSSEDFWCGPSGSVQTLELHCHGEGCHIEFWQDYYFKPRFGIYISQEPSL